MTGPEAGPEAVFLGRTDEGELRVGVWELGQGGGDFVGLQRDRVVVFVGAY